MRTVACSLRQGQGAAVTPVLFAVYEELVRRASAPPHAGVAQVLLRRFFEKTGAFASDHPSAQYRLAAAWEDALCRGGLAGRLAAELDDPAERSLALLFSRAHRGVFRFERHGAHHFVHDLWSGASFIIVSRDDVARAVQGDNLGALCEARLVGASDGCAFLPGTVFHSAQATPFVEQVLSEAMARGMNTDDVCDALLRMDHSLSVLSRVRPAYAYRIEGLEPKQ